MQDAQQRLSAQSARAPTISDLAPYLEMSEEEVLDGLQTAEAYDTPPGARRRAERGLRSSLQRWRELTENEPRR